MKNIFKSRIARILLTLTLAVGLMPAGTALAVPAPTGITEVNVEGVTLPVYGRTAKASVTIPGDGHFHVASVEEGNETLTDDGASISGGLCQWADIENGYRMMAETDRFTSIAKENYFLCLLLVPDEGYFFKDELTLKINGDPDLVDKNVTIRYANGNIGVFSANFTARAAYEMEMPFTLNVEQLGTEVPGKETFTFSAYDLEGQDKYLLADNSITVKDLKFTDGKASVQGVIRMLLGDPDDLAAVSDGFRIKMDKGSSEGWNYAEEEWTIRINDSIAVSDGTEGTAALSTTPFEMKDGQMSEMPSDRMSFDVSYNENKAAPPADADEDKATKDPAVEETPETGDDSNMMVWLILMAVSAVSAGSVLRRGSRS